MHIKLKFENYCYLTFGKLAILSGLAFPDIDISSSCGFYVSGTI